MQEELNKREKELDEIFSELRDVAAIYEDDYLKSILSKWRIVDNVDLIKELKIYILDLQVDPDGEDSQYARKFIKCNDGKSLIEITKLSTITKKEEFDFSYGCNGIRPPKYSIIFNEENTTFGNIKKLVYNNKETRDKEFTRIEKKLKDFKIVIL